MSVLGLCRCSLFHGCEIAFLTNPSERCCHLQRRTPNTPTHDWPFALACPAWLSLRDTPRRARPSVQSVPRSNETRSDPLTCSTRSCACLPAVSLLHPEFLLRFSPPHPRSDPWPTSSRLLPLLPLLLPLTTVLVLTMEPVPETERMEEFRPSPLPTLHLGASHYDSSLDLHIIKKPTATRRSTDPIPSSYSSFNSWTPSPTAIPFRPRNASPLHNSHTRSLSATSIASAPSMSRARSMPGVNGSGHILLSPQLRPASPSSPSRVRTPRKPSDEAFPPMSPVRTTVLEPERRSSERSSSPSLRSSSSSSTRLRRTSSPFRNMPSSSIPSYTTLPVTPSSTASSPLYRGYDSLGTSFGGSLSSIPSTPTSARSRSPSISSLETIPDSPDAEEAALEAERQAQLQAAANEAAEGSDSSTDSKGRSSLDNPSRGRTLAFGSRDKRKRWSVCGAERRGDLDLETIWED